MSFTALVKTLGRKCAVQELRWMQQAVHNDRQALAAMLARRAAGEPLQYILGTQPFGRLDLLVRAPVLIPRTETEHWALQLAERCRPAHKKSISVLDLCTGTGCIPLLLCNSWPQGSTRTFGVDVSPDAVQLATENAARSGTPVTPTEDANVFKPLLQDIFSSSFPAFTFSLNNGMPFDILTSNPPYISAAEYASLPTCVKDYEDPRALLAAEDGLAFYRRIAQFLHPTTGLVQSDGGTVVLEVGAGQAKVVREILCKEGGTTMERTEIWKDPWGKDRVVFARL